MTEKVVSVSDWIGETDEEAYYFGRGFDIRCIDAMWMPEEVLW